MENGATSEGKDPSSFLGEIIGAPVTVKLNSGVVYKGALLSQYVTVSRILLTISFRRTSIGRWLHEYCAGEVEGICEWKFEAELRRCFRPGE